jgi:hypothetical protein
MTMAVDVTTTAARRRAVALLVATAAFAGLIAVAMATYHGGSRLEPGSRHYQLLGNFLSDLGTSVTYSGSSNAVPSLLFLVATSIIGAGLVWSAPMWSALAADRPGRPGAVAARVATVTTALAGIGFVAVGLIPWNRDLAFHVLVVQLVFAFLVVFAASLVVLQLGRDPSERSVGPAVALLGCLLAYLALIVFGPGLGSTEGMSLQVAAQKVVVVVTMLLVGMQALSIATRRRSAPATAAASASSTHRNGSTPHVNGSTPRGRLPGVDLARAVAMLGMLIVHTKDNLPIIAAPDRALIWVNVWVGPLFALVAGVGLSLGWRHRRTTRFRTMVLLRAAALLLIGLWLESLFIGSILQYFAIYFALGVLALRASRRVLVALAAACIVLGPLVITFLLRQGTITLFLGLDRGLGSLTHPLELTRALTVDGRYPAIVWSGFFFAGMAIGRLDLRSRRLAVRLATVGLGVGALGAFVGWIATRTFRSDPVGWSHHWTAAAHSESVTWAITALALACGVLGASLLIADRFPRPGAVLAPILALGQVPLTFYLVHLWYSDTLWWNVNEFSTSTGAYLVATLAFYATFAGAAWLWLRVFRHGPVEGLIDLPIRLIARPRPLADATPERSAAPTPTPAPTT